MKKFNIAISLILSFFLTGCFDKVELEERAFVLAMSIDKYKDYLDTNIEKAGEEKRYVIGMSMPEISEGEKSGNNESNPMENEKKAEGNSINKSIKQGEGSSLSSTMNLIDTYTSQNLYYGHTKAIILGKNILEDENYFKEVIDTLDRNKQISRKIIILASKSNAKDILEIIPKDEKMIGIYINDFYKNNKRNSSFTFRMDLEDIIKNLYSLNGDTIIPTVEIKNDDIHLDGIAILKNYKLISYLDNKQTKGLLWILDKNSLGTITTNFENSFVSLDIFKKNTKIDFSEENGKIVCNVNINVNGNISGYTLNNEIFESGNKYIELEKQYEKDLYEEIKYSLENIKNINSDILSLKEKIRKNNFNLYEKYNLEENNIYNNIEFKINCNVNIKGFGTIK